MKPLMNIIFLISFSLSGCKSSTFQSYDEIVLPFLREVSESYKPGIYDGVKEPSEFPNLRKDQETLLGIDSNKDGVRDDLEIFLNRYVKYDYERIVLKNFFRTDKDFYKSYSQKDKEGLSASINQGFRILECLFFLRSKYHLPMSIYDKEFNVFIVLHNTPLRSSASDSASRLLVGESYGSGVSTSRERFGTCPVEIKNKYPYKD